MSAALHSWAEWSGQLGFLWEIGVKSTLILAITFVLHFLLKRRQAIVCTAVWNAALLALLILAVTGWIGPRFVLPLPVAVPFSQISSPATVPAPDHARSGGEAMYSIMAVEGGPRFSPPTVNSGAPAEGLSIVTGDSQLPGAEVPQEGEGAFPGWLLVALGCGISIGMARLLLSLAAVNRLRREAQPVTNVAWRASVDQLSRDLGIHREVRILASAGVNVPLVVGVIRPCILVPRPLSEQPQNIHIKAILAHELAHVSRGDYAWQLIYRIVQALYWYQPLIWLVGRPLSLAREQACDEYAVHAVGGSGRYASALLAMAEQMVRRRSPSLGLAVTGTPKIAIRLQAIRSSRGSNVCKMDKLPTLALLGIGVMLGYGLAVSVLQAETAPSEKSPAIQDSQGAQDSGQAVEPGDTSDSFFDQYGDPLPPETLLRLGTTRFRQGGYSASSVAYSPSRNVLASSDGQSIVLWDADTGRRVREIPVKFPPNRHIVQGAKQVEKIAFSPVSDELAAACSDGIVRFVRIWNLETNEETSFEYHPYMGIVSDGIQRSFCYSPDGQHLSLITGGLVLVFHKDSGQVIEKINPRQGRATSCLTWTPDGNFIAFGKIDPAVELWNIRTGEFVRTFGLDGYEFALSLAVSPDGKTLAAGCKEGSGAWSKVGLWDLATGELRRTLPCEGDPIAVRFLADGETLISASEDGHVEFWDVTSGQRVDRIEAGLGVTRDAALSSTEESFALATVASEIRQWDVQTRQQKLTDFIGHKTEVQAVAYSPDGTVIATGARDGETFLWDAQQGTRLRSFASTRYPTLAFNISGNLLATAGLANGKTYIWDVRTGTQLHVLEHGIQNVHQVAFSRAEDELIVIGSHSSSPYDSRPIPSRLQVWDAKAGRRLKDSPYLTPTVLSMETVSDGQSVVLATADHTGSRALQIVNFQTGQSQALLQGHTAAVDDVDYKNGLMVSASLDNTIRLWEVASRKSLAMFHGHAHKITGVALSPHGDLVASCDLGGSIRLWNTTTQQKIYEYENTGYGCNALCFSPDGTRLVSAMKNATAIVWDTSKYVNTNP